MSTSAKIGLGVILVVAIVAGVAVMRNNHATPLPEPQQTATTTTETTLNFDQSISDGTITAVYPSVRWGLATNTSQILVKSYIPPCDQTFSYCFYFTGNDFQGTNFESAGLRIAKRPDLKAERLCLQTPPEGFGSRTTPSATYSHDEYSSSVFSNVGQGAAGHLAAGKLYRLFVRASSTCYEFETRVGQSQFANYPAGTIQEFTPVHQAALETELEQILNNISLPSGTKNLFS